MKMLELETEYIRMLQELGATRLQLLAVAEAIKPLGSEIILVDD